MQTIKQEKKTICPGCGKIEVKEEVIFLCEVLQGETKEVKAWKISEIDGLRWCNVCR